MLPIIEKLVNGKRHCEDGPAVEWSNGNKTWYIEGNLHREDGPAVEYANGDKRYYVNGLCHREDAPAVEWALGAKEWFIKNNRHRMDGPAFECDGQNKWYLYNMDLYVNWHKTLPNNQEVPAYKEALGYKERIILMRYLNDSHNK